MHEQAREFWERSIASLTFEGGEPAVGAIAFDVYFAIVIPSRLAAPFVKSMSPRRPPRRNRPISTATVAGVCSLVMPAVSLFRIYLSTGSLWPFKYSGLVSTVTLLLYEYDKMQPRNLEWRAKEATLHTLELIGGWPCALLGMHYFRHKTRKMSFQAVFWGIILGWQGVWWTIWSGGIVTY
ncbi:DUF1294-domain-containing protein [Lojkania enalia]|uniref:DUF1294-domain-containing protein n=1 Tax=Lojkania enalia TaxID=147567 RepID=A0A9P4K2D7_9PLEO|nr:DUF1294-domain-containing protein [Didymosphaeria enalia]